MTAKESHAREFIEKDIDSYFVPVLLDGMWGYMDECLEILEQ